MKEGGVLQERVDLKPLGHNPRAFSIHFSTGGIVMGRYSRAQYKRIATMGVLTALSVVMLLVLRIPFPPAPFLIYEPADVTLLVAGFALGPLPGLICTAVACSFQAILLSSDGWFGGLMHFISSGALVAVSAVIYSRHKTKKGAYLALAAGGLAMVGAMIPANLFLIPMFYGMPRQVVVDMIWWIVLFNVLKAGINSALTALVYKPLSGLIKAVPEEPRRSPARVISKNTSERRG